MAKSSTSFGPNNTANLSGRPPLTPEQRAARDYRATKQLALAEMLFGLAMSSALEPKDRIAAAKVLVEELPIEVRDVTEGEQTPLWLKRFLAAGGDPVAIAKHRK